MTRGVGLENSYPFGGVAGETVRRFTAFSTVFTLFPAFVLTGVLALAAHFLCKWLQLPEWVSFLVSVIFTSPVIAKSALAARDGELDAGFLSNWNLPELLGFVLRYTVLTIAWGVPVVLAANYLAASMIGKALTPLGFISARGAMLVLELVVLIAIAVIAPTLSLIIATREQSIASCFSGEAWGWLLDRRGDLPAYYSAAIGGAVVFSLLVTPVMLVVVALAFLVRIEAGMAAAAVAYGLLVVGSAVLVGRLTGAFVLSETGAPEESAAPVAPPPKPARSVPVPSPAAPHLAGMDIIAIAVKKLVLTEDAAVPAAIAEAETLRARTPDHAGLLAELAKLYLRAQRIPEAIATASEAISRALAAGEMPLAISCHEAFHAHRKSLTVKGPELEQLGRGLLEQKKFGEAAWCFASSGRTGGDAVRVQKGLIASAEGLNKIGQLIEAKRIYQFVVNFTPGSPNAQYCQDALARINSRLKKAGA
jgi:hypothetical protein